MVSQSIVTASMDIILLYTKISVFLNQFMLQLGSNWLILGPDNEQAEI